MKFLILFILGTLSLVTSSAAGQSIEEIQVHGPHDDRLNEKLNGLITLDRQDITDAAALKVDDILGQVPGVGLFRRTSSRVAHPTTQGVSVRNIGPNGAGRTLVLLDGIPLNDPFGGWVSWERVPKSSLERVEILKGGSAGSWGSAALGGVIRLTSRVPDGNSLAADGSAGSKNTYTAAANTSFVAGQATTSVRGSYFTSDGYYNLRRQNRGAIDRPLDLESYTARIASTVELANEMKATVWGDYFHEDRGNGTPLARNSNRMAEAALRLESPGDEDDINWWATAYIQDENFRNQFTSVSDDRSSETPALNQASVPSRAVGGRAVVSLPVSDASRLELGGDLRFLKGKTNEQFFFSNGDFLRERTAGGRQDFAGIFAAWHATLSGRLTVSLTSRLDYWQNRDGKRVESVRADGSLLLDQVFADRDGFESSFSAAVSYLLADGVRARFNAYTGFRVPTINELYRPFRVRSDITEANAALKNEKLKGLEAGLNWQPTKAITLDADIFYNRIDNAIANVTLTITPGFYAPLGVFVPTSGSLRQRQNLDRINVLGVEASLKARLTESLNLNLGYLFTRAHVGDNAFRTGLAGKRLAQVPRHEVSAGIRWQPMPKTTLAFHMNYESNQYEDDLNIRRLGNYVQTGLSVNHALSPRIEIYAAAENLFNRTNVVALASTGLESIGSPRLIYAGIRFRSGP